MDNSNSEEVEVFEDEKEEEKDPLWKLIIEKIKPFLTRGDIIHMDLDTFSSLVKRLFEIKEITEQEMTYAKKNRDLILIRMGLLHNIPDLDEKDLEQGLRQLAVRLVNYYYKNNVVGSLEEGEKKVLGVIEQGFTTSVTISLNPEEELTKLKEMVGTISRINLENATDIIEVLQKTKDNLMNIGISGSVFYEIDKFCKLLKKTNQEDLPTKADIVEAIYEWQLKIQK